VLVSILLEVGNQIQNISLDDIASIAIVILALILSSVSIVAYKKTGLSRLVLISIAFAFFGINVLLEHLGLLFPNLNITNSFALLNSLMNFLILMLFFIALVKRWNTPKRKKGRR